MKFLCRGLIFSLPLWDVCNPRPYLDFLIVSSAYKASSSISLLVGVLNCEKTFLGLDIGPTYGATPVILEFNALLVLCSKLISDLFKVLQLLRNDREWFLFFGLQECAQNRFKKRFITKQKMDEDEVPSSTILLNRVSLTSWQPRDSAAFCRNDWLWWGRGTEREWRVPCQYAAPTPDWSCSNSCFACYQNVQILKL